MRSDVTTSGERQRREAAAGRAREQRLRKGTTFCWAVLYMRALEKDSLSGKGQPERVPAHGAAGRIPEFTRAKLSGERWEGSVQVPLFLALTSLLQLGANHSPERAPGREMKQSPKGEERGQRRTRDRPRGSPGRRWAGMGAGGGPREPTASLLGPVLDAVWTRRHPECPGAELPPSLRARPWLLQSSHAVTSA